MIFEKHHQLSAEKILSVACSFAVVAGFCSMWLLSWNKQNNPTALAVEFDKTSDNIVLTEKSRRDIASYVQFAATHITFESGRPDSCFRIFNRLGNTIEDLPKERESDVVRRFLRQELQNSGVDRVIELQEIHGRESRQPGVTFVGQGVQIVLIPRNCQSSPIL